MQYTEEQLTNAREKAPEDIQGLLNDPDFGAVVFMFAANQHIDDDKALDIEDAVIHTLLGLESFADLKENIQKLGVLPKAAEKIVEELDTNIFTNVKASLDGMQKKEIPILKVPSTLPPSTTQAKMPPKQPVPSVPTPVDVKRSEAKNALVGLITPPKKQSVPETPPNLPTAPIPPITTNKPTTPRHIFEKALQEKEIKQPTKQIPPTTQTPTHVVETKKPPTPVKTHPTSKAPYPKDFNKPPEHVDPYREEV